MGVRLPSARRNLTSPVREKGDIMKKRSLPTGSSLWEGSVLLLFSVALLAHSLYSHYTGLPVSWQMSPYLFPALVGGGLLFPGLRIMFSPKERGEKTEERRGSIQGVLPMVCGTGVYLLLLPVLGFLPSTVLFLIGTLGLLGKRNWRQTLFLSVLLPVVLHGLFSGLLHVMLP